VKLLINMVGPRAPTAILGPLGFKFHSLEEANAIADCLGKQFTPYDLCEENHKRKVQDILETVSIDHPPQKDKTV
jgi:hypothetical protein